MKKYTKIIVDIPRGFVESLGNKEDFHRLHLNANEEYDYTNWQLSELEELAKKLLLFIKEVKGAKIVPPVKHIK